MKYRRKSEIIEAVKWDGKIETIKQNEYLEEAIKEDRILLGMNEIDGKEVLLLINDDLAKEYIKVEEGDYIIKETYNQKYKIRTMEADEFEKYFEVVEPKNNNCFVVDLELNTEEFHKKLNEAREELEEVLKFNIKDNLNKLFERNK